MNAGNSHLGTLNDWLRVRMLPCWVHHVAGDLAYARGGPGYFQRKWMKRRPKFFESFSTRWYSSLISF